eukprot:COSAG02_NODE_321_length_24780_cov_11.623962_2_plen_48_part_00
MRGEKEALCCQRAVLPVVGGWEENREEVRGTGLGGFGLGLLSEERCA